MDLDDAALFVRIVELGTLSAAAREREVPVSQVSRALNRLEARCAVRLLHRNTHGLSLTDEGDTVLAHARRLLEVRAELDSALSGRLAGPSGWVRLSVSTITAETVIAPSLPTLQARHPQLQLDISTDDRVVDMVREGVDIAIRTGSPAGDNLVARQIGELRRGLYASPDYLRRHGQPATPADLARHRLIGNSLNPALNLWPLPGGAVHAVRGHTRVDSTAVALSLARAGAGIGRFIDIAAAPLLASGQLLPVLAGQLNEEPLPLFAVMLHERQRLPKLRACIAHWADWLAGRVPPLD
ncbi:LysR family transcriptional regulator [Aquabacterium sp. OR-4]|uniref:LysR family transcriptional regulator n=1 Tax=Aquabacterium sp. OR-4 TaxID=2978127 RepID=UPI0021B18F61|nr:LysR family transcriptional regulator [Aquabacterium sp. OR-4]MDT7833748.1 LysR family transcriptional regulator [Aquabacterium sp. OR-4]